jgi:hypothetical protein
MVAEDGVPSLSTRDMVMETTGQDMEYKHLCKSFEGDLV